MINRESTYMKIHSPWISWFEFYPIFDIIFLFNNSTVKIYWGNKELPLNNSDGRNTKQWSIVWGIYGALINKCREINYFIVWKDENSSGRCILKNQV